MLINEQNLKLWYREYKKQFEKTTKYVKSRGGQVRTGSASDYEWFKTDFMSEALGSKLSGKQIAQKMAKAEVYTVSSKQARLAAETLSNKTGKKLTPNMLASFKLNLFKQTEEYRASLDDTKSSYEKNKDIAQFFFGSV